MAPSKQNNLILITNHFPYGGAEAFLESEINFLTDHFDKVIIAARDVTSSGERKGKFTANRINPKSDWKEMFITAGLYVRHFRKILNYVSTEIRLLKSSKKSISLSIARVMIHDLTKALITSYHLNCIIRQYALRDNVILYSYWLTSSALATLFVCPQNLLIKRISRAHGGDVYEFRNKLHYLSFRSVLVQELDAIYAISENGGRHLQNSVLRSNEQKIRVSRLATMRPRHIPDKTNEKIFIVVSCSYLVPVKRIHLLIDALSHIKDLPVTWIHIGDGPLKQQAEEYASHKLSGMPLLSHQFKGAMSNEDLVRFYEQNFIDLFLNTSESEGVPVTIMEAQSFGIPVIAPETGGVPEIVSNENGRLFPVNASASHIGESIREVLGLPREAADSLRLNARRNWENRFNAEKNFPTFVTEIFNLIS